MKEDAFDRYEQLPAAYHKDPRWKIVKKLRKEKKHTEANGLVLQIRGEYGFYED